MKIFLCGIGATWGAGALLLAYAAFRRSEATAFAATFIIIAAMMAAVGAASFALGLKL